MISLRERNCTDIIKIAVFELYSNGNEKAIKPLTLPAPPPTASASAKRHAELTTTIIRELVPNAEIYLLPPTSEGINFVIDNNIPLVNMSLSNTYVMSLEPKMAEKAFLVTSAGNAGEKGESMSARKEYWCAVGAVDASLNPQSYSSWGRGAIKTCAMTGHKQILGMTAHGTSFAAPVVVGLLAQWFIWYNKITGSYPKIAEVNNFIKINSHDLWEDGKDLRTGYGLFRLPKQFELDVIDINDAKMSVVKTKYVENETPVTKEIILSAAAMTSNNKLSINDIDLIRIFDHNMIKVSDTSLKVIR